MARSPITGRTIMESWVHLFIENERRYAAGDPKKRPLTDKQLIRQMMIWFPASAGKAGTVRVDQYRCGYNTGTSEYRAYGPAGLTPNRPYSCEYDARGNRVEWNSEVKKKRGKRR